MSTEATTTSISAPYTAINNQNQSLQKFISGIGDYHSLEHNQFNRKNDTLPILGYIKNGLVILYGIVFLVLALVFFMKGRGLSIYMKIGLIVGFALYPFFIYPTENALYQLYYYTYSVIYGESYASIMSRKGLQNPKNFKDITNLAYYMGNFGAISRDPIIELRDQINKLPDALKTGFSKLQDMVNSLPDNAQQSFINLQNDIITLYKTAKRYIASLTNQEKIKTELEKFKTEVETRITGFWSQIKDIFLTETLKKNIENTITNLQVQLNIQMYLQKLPDILKTSFGELQQKMSTLSDDVNYQILVLYQDIVIGYQDFKTQIYNLKDINKIKTAATDFGTTVKNKIQEFWNNTANANLSDDTKATITNSIADFLTQLNIQANFDQIKSTIPNSSTIINQKFTDLQNTINNILSKQANDLLANKNVLYSNEEINGFINKNIIDMNEKISGFLTELKNSSESNDIKNSINNNCLKIYCSIVFVDILTYTSYFIYQINNTTTTTITSENKNRLIQLLNNYSNYMITVLQTTFESASSKEDINKLIQTMKDNSKNKADQLITTNIANFSISVPEKSVLITQITDKSGMVNTFLDSQITKYNNLSNIMAV